MGWYNTHFKSAQVPPQPAAVQPVPNAPVEQGDPSASSQEPADQSIESAADEETLNKAYERYHDILKYSPDHDKQHAMQRAAELFGLSYEDLVGYANDQSTVL